MALTDQRASEILKLVLQYALCVVVAIVVGWWIASAYYLIALSTILAIGFAFAVTVNTQIAMIGLLFFSPILSVIGLVVPLPYLNEYNLIAAFLLFIMVARYTMTKRWDFKIGHPWINKLFLLYFTLIFISSFRGFLNFPNFEFVRTTLQIDKPINIITSQFIKPVLYMSMLFFGYNSAKDFVHRRNLNIVMGFGLILYSMTMLLQYAGAFPLLSAQAGKEAGGILGASNILGAMLAFCFVLFLARKPYFEHGLPMIFSWVVVAVSIVAMAFTRSRTAWVLATLGALLLAATSRRWHQRIIATTCIVGAVVTSPLWAPQIAKDHWNRTTITTQDDPNAVLSGRVEIWDAAIQYLKSNPTILFFGGGKFDFYTKGPEYGLRIGFSTHHWIMQSLVDEGIVGLTIVLALYARIMWGLVRAWRRDTNEEIRFFARQMTIMTILVFAYGNPIDDRTVTWYWFLLGMFLAAKDQADRAAAVPVESRQPQNLAPARPRSVPQWAVRRGESRA